MEATANRKRILIPKEHGAWGMLLVSFVIGLSVAPRRDALLFLLAGAVLSLYLARYPLVLWARSGFSKFPEESLPAFLFFSSAGLFLGALLIFRDGLWLLAPLGAASALFFLVHLWLTKQRKERTELGEFTGILAIALTAPAAFYVSGGEISKAAFWLYLLCALYFGTSIFYVKMKVSHRMPVSNPRRQDSARFAGSLLVYQVAALITVACLSALGVVPSLTLLAFLPLTFYVLAGSLRRDEQLSIRKLGYTLVLHSAIFSVVLIAVFRAAGL